MNPANLFLYNERSSETLFFFHKKKISTENLAKYLKKKCFVMKHYLNPNFEKSSGSTFHLTL